MSWGEPQQPPYDPNNPYGQPQQPYQQGGQPQQQQPGVDPTVPVWGAQPPADSGAGYTQPMPDPNNPYGQPQQNPFGAPAAPYGQQPGYGQPGYGQQPVYGQPEFAQYPAAPPKKGNGMFIAILVGALVVIGGGVGAAIVLTGNHKNTPVAGPTTSNSVLTSSAPTTAASSSTSASTSSTSTSSGSLTAPSSVQGLTVLQNSVAQSAVSAMKSSLSSDADLYPDPLLAAYNDAGGDNVTTILVDQAMSDLTASNQAELTSSGSASDVVSEIMTGAGVSNAQTESTNASDGALSCGTKVESGTKVTICVWYDDTTFGTLQYLDGTSPSTAAPVADAVRAAAEG